MSMRHLILMYLLCSAPIIATEVDSFSLRDPTLQDSLSELNGIVHGYLEKSIKKANKKNSCSPEVFEDIFHSLTGGLFWADIENQIEKSTSIDKRIISRKNSIYKDFEAGDVPALFLARLGYILKIGDFYIGSDKFGHFLDQGHDYFIKNDLEQGIEFGEMTERTYYGLMATGVYSYGDLSANLEGYRFWSNLARGEHSYVGCSRGQWEQKRNFDWSEYINAALDEGLNCSAYRLDKMVNFVSLRIEQLGMTCPVDKSYCPAMIERYGRFAPRVISQACFY